MVSELELPVSAVHATQYLVPVYLAYALISLALTIFLARTLFKNGAVFLKDVFAEKPELAEAVNRLLVVGFYLFNLGYAALLLRADQAPTAVAAIETLASKLGLLLLSLAGMHFANLLVFHQIRRRSRPELKVAHSPYRVEADHGRPRSAFERIEERAAASAP